MPLKVTLLSEHSRPPIRLGPDSVSYTLYSSMDAEILPHAATTVSLGLTLGFPDNATGLILPDSELTAHYGIFVAPILLEAGQSEPVYVHLFNRTGIKFHINTGDLVARLVVLPFLTPVIEVAERAPSNRIIVNGHCSALR